MSREQYESEINLFCPSFLARHDLLYLFLYPQCLRESRVIQAEALLEAVASAYHFVFGDGSRDQNMCANRSAISNILTLWRCGEDSTRAEQ
jgi:hypothetical protein